jgi:hypothetical protein
MPFCKKIYQGTLKSRRTLERLQDLRSGLRVNIPKRSQQKNLWLATWNNHDLDLTAFGNRILEDAYY